MLKTLHVCNIANMAFDYCWIQNSHGISSSVMCYDLDLPTCDPKFSQFYDGKDDLKFFENFNTLEYISNIPSPPKEYFEWLQAIVRNSKKNSIDNGYNFDDLYKYHYYEIALSSKFKKLKPDVVYCYAYAAIPMMIHSEVPYVPIDVGGLREIEKKDDPYSKLIIHAYRNAPRIIITNPDVVSSLKALQMEHYTFMPHPVNMQLYKKRHLEDNEVIKLRASSDFIILSPTRHDWDIKGSDKLIKAFSHFINAGHKGVLVLIKWGNEIGKSERLIKELGIENHVIWVDMVNEKKLSELINMSDVVCDQFGISKTLGLIGLKTMSTGKPLITSYDESTHQEFFECNPPILKSFSPEEIFDKLLYCYKNSDIVEKYGTQGRQWIETTHNDKIIYEKFNEIQESLLEKTSCLAYSFMKQKKLEIVYEAEYAPIYDSKYHTPVCYEIMDEYLSSFISKHSKKKDKKIKLLDLGCGPASMVKSLIKALPNALIYGVDISPSMVKLAKKNFPEFEFVVGDADDIPFEDNYFDVVLCSGMLHHFPDISLVLSEIRRVLKMDGIFVAREPNHRSFANHIPNIPFLHLCLKHSLYQAMKKTSLLEPEEHEFHRDYSFEDFPAELSKYFVVEDLDCTLSVAYFYDMIDNSNFKDDLIALESTLKDFPGLNMLTLCRKCRNPGSYDQVKPIQKKYSDILEKPCESLLQHHLLQLDTFGNKVLSYYDTYQHLQHKHRSIKNLLSRKNIEAFFKGALAKRRTPFNSHGSEKSLPTIKICTDKIEFVSFNDKFTEDNLKNASYSLDRLDVIIDGDIKTTTLVKVLNLAKDYAPVKVLQSPGSKVFVGCPSDVLYLQQIYLCPDNFYRRYALGKRLFFKGIQSLLSHKQMSLGPPSRENMDKSATNPLNNLFSKLNIISTGQKYNDYE